MSAHATDAAVTVRERPILFSGPMVRAILAGTKTQTRRVVKDATGAFWDHAAWTPHVERDGIHWRTNDAHRFLMHHHRPPYGFRGDRLWVRETWAPFSHPELFTCVKFAADKAVMKPTMWTNEQGAWCEAHEEDDVWRPSIHMPRWASRLTLEVVAVRVERLQDISESDARAEGYPGTEVNGRHIPWSPRGWFTALWDSLKAARGFGWAANPWVWVVEFRRVLGDTEDTER